MKSRKLTRTLQGLKIKGEFTLDALKLVTKVCFLIIIPTGVIMDRIKVVGAVAIMHGITVETDLVVLLVLTFSASLEEAIVGMEHSTITTQSLDVAIHAI